MNRILQYLGLKEPPRDTTLIEETHGLRVAMETVAQRLGEVAEGIREANERLDPSGIPWEDMSRGGATRSARRRGLGGDRR